MAKLSVARCNENISRGTWRKEFLQLQVDIVCVIENKEPVSIGVARKPTQACIYGSLGISWSDRLEIRCNSLFTRGVNIEDIGETKRIECSVNLLSSLTLFGRLAYRLSLDSSINLNASWLFPAPPRPYNTKMRWKVLPTSESKYPRILSRISFRPVNEATGGGHNFRPLWHWADSSGGLGET